MTEAPTPPPFEVGGHASSGITIHDLAPLPLALVRPLELKTVSWSAPLSESEREAWARLLAQVYDVPLWVVGVGRPPSHPSRVANAAYRQRQKNRVKRRRR